MGLSINLQTPVVGFGTFGLTKGNVEITNGGVAVTTRVFTFALSHFSCECDIVNENIASIHYGNHVLNISNGEYTELYLDGVAKSSIYELVNAYSEIVTGLS